MNTHSDADQVTIPLRPQTTGQIASKEEAVGLLRSFYLGNPQVSHSEEFVHGQYLPAFLSPYRYRPVLRHDYPLLFLASLADTPPSLANAWSLAKWPPIASPSENSDPDRLVLDSRQEKDPEKDNSDGIGVFPLPGLFKSLMADFPMEAVQRRLLEENLIRLEKHVIEIVDKGGEAPKDANTVLDQAALTLQDSLRLGEKQQEQLRIGLKQLMERMPSGYFLPFGRRVPLHILAQLAKLRFQSQYEKTLRQVKQLVSGLTALIEIEKNKSIESIEPRMVLNSIGPTGSRFMDPLALSDLMDHTQGSQGMSPERLRRVRETLHILEDERISDMGSMRLTLIRDTAIDEVYGLSGILLPPDLSEEWKLRESSDPFATAMAVFDQQAAMLVRLARAMRIASLDLENTYDAKIHDPWFEDFDWRALSEEESKLAPVVVVIDSASNVAHNGLIGLSRLLRADRPVQVLLEVDPGMDPGADMVPDTEEGSEHIIGNDRRMELGYLGIGYQRATVTQSSATRPFHLLQSFAMALQRERPALHLLARVGIPAHGNAKPLLSPWLMESAAVEGRAHPLFQYDPAIGGKWWIPLSLADNPQQATDWPTYPFQYRTEDGAVTEIEMTFGFVDYALLDPRWWRYFHPVPDTLETKEIIPLSDYLALEPEQIGNRLPFLWAVYDDQRTSGTRLRRLIISRTLILACLDRREFWRTLQALAGVRNHHVETAVARVSAEAKDNAERQQALLMAQHNAELTKVRQEAGADTLRQLTETLLTMDFAPPSTTSDTEPFIAPSPPSLAGTPVAEQNENPQQTEVASESDPELITEPWIDTPLCTTCNECINLNPKLFVYNEDKQAEIGDLSAGTQAELVEAAEMCPAHCIHPGVSA